MATHHQSRSSSISGCDFTRQVRSEGNWARKAGVPAHLHKRATAMRNFSLCPTCNGLSEIQLVELVTGIRYRSRMLERTALCNRDRPFVVLQTRSKICYSQKVGRRSIRVQAASVLKDVPTWQQLSACAGASALEGYMVRRNEVPKSAPTPTLPTTADAETDKPVLLYRYNLLLE